MKITTAQEVENLKVRARGGSLEQRARYVSAKRNFDTLVEAVFDDGEYPYTISPSEQYLTSLRKEAEDKDNEVAQARLKLIQANRDSMDRKIAGDDVKDFRVQKQRVRNAANNLEEKVTSKMIEDARLVVVRNPSLENRVAYAKLKRRLERGE